MKMPARLLVLTIALLLVIAAWAAAQRQEGPVQQIQPPIVLSGGDVGFRIEARRGDVPLGKLVVRVDGRWVEAQLGGGAATPIPLR